LQCVAVCCSVLQCVAVCCSVLQCVAVCCSVLQCVAVCCSVHNLVGHLHVAVCVVQCLWKCVLQCVCCRVVISWSRLVQCLISWVVFRKLATNYRALLQEMIYKVKAPYGSLPPYNTVEPRVYESCHIQMSHSIAVIPLGNAVMPLSIASNAIEPCVHESCHIQMSHITHVHTACRKCE